MDRKGRPKEASCQPSRRGRRAPARGAGLRPGAGRDEVAGLLGSTGSPLARSRARAEPLLHPDDVPLSVGRGAARRATSSPSPASTSRDATGASRARRLRADRLRRLRDPQRELRAEGRHAPAQADPAQHRELPPPAEADGAHGRLVARGRARPTPPTTAGRSGSSCSSSSTAWPTAPRRRSTGARPAQTVLADEQVIDGFCERHPEARGREARHGAVVLPDHRLRAAPARQPRLDRLVGDDQGGADELDRAQRRGRDRLPGARAQASRSASSRPGPTRLRRDLHGAGAGASARRRTLADPRAR